MYSFPFAVSVLILQNEHNDVNLLISINLISFLFARITFKQYPRKDLHLPSHTSVHLSLSHLSCIPSKQISNCWKMFKLFAVTYASIALFHINLPAASY